MGSIRAVGSVGIYRGSIGAVGSIGDLYGSHKGSIGDL